MYVISIQEILYGIEQRPRGTLLRVPSRRLDDRIRELCAKVTVASETELMPNISALKAALHEHTERLRKLAATKLVGSKSGQTKRRA